MAKIFVVCFFCMLTSLYSSTAENKHQPFENQIQFLGFETLEKAGFEHFTPENFRLLITNEYAFVLNRKDNMVVRFKGEKPEKVYKAAGQGPAHFLKPTSMFLMDKETVGIFDGIKYTVLMFDRDLNYKKEIRVSPSIRTIAKVSSGYIAFGDFDQGHMFASLTEEFKTVRTFGNRERKASIRVFPGSLYMGYLLNDGDVADTSWLHASPTCSVKIIEVASLRVKTVLEWKNPFPPTQKDFDELRNLYSSYYVEKHGQYYVVQNILAKAPKQRIPELKIFSVEGKTVGTYIVDFTIIPAISERDEERIYVMGDDENISYWNVLEPNE
jgi:hypothetical protein